jgi:hypothetical protein
MGVKFALPPSTADSPTHVDGMELFRVPIESEPGTQGLRLRARYWDGATELGERLVDLYESKIVKYGGTPSNWAALKALAGNPSDFDDVAEALKDATWGADILWACWYGMIGE